MRTSLGFALLGLLLCAPGAANAYVMTDGSMRAGLDSWAFSGSSADPNQLSFDGGLTDHVYEIYGYLGNTSNVVRVTPANFDEQVAIGGSGSTASSQLVLNATGAAALGLAAGDITLDYGFQISDATQSLIWDVGVNNASLAPLDLVFYAYFDLDLEDSFDDDLATGGVDGFRVTDGATGFVLAVGATAAADHYQVSTFPIVRNALDAMQGVGVADLPDTGTPFGPGDFTGALQFDVSVAAGGSQGLGITLIPEPSTAAQLALGLLGLAFAGRKRA
jgi:hypothetical protein